MQLSEVIYRSVTNWLYDTYKYSQEKKYKRIKLDYLAVYNTGSLLPTHLRGNVLYRQLKSELENTNAGNVFIYFSPNECHSKDHPLCSALNLDKHPLFGKIIGHRKLSPTISIQMCNKIFIMKSFFDVQILLQHRYFRHLKHIYYKNKQLHFEWSGGKKTILTWWTSRFRSRTRDTNP